MIRRFSMEMVLLVDNDPPPLLHRITFSYYCQSCPILRLLCPHTSESPTYCKSLPSFYFLTFEKADCAIFPQLVGTKLLMMMHLRCFIAGENSHNLQFTRFQCVKFLCPKIGSCNFFGKF